MPEFLPLEHACDAVGLNANNAGIKLIVNISCHSQMVGQEPHLARHRVVPHDIYHAHILLSPLGIVQLLLGEANLASHLELHPKAGVVGPVASPILGRGSYYVNHCIDQASNNACTILPKLGSLPGVHGHTLHNNRWPIGGSRCHSG